MTWLGYASGAPHAVDVTPAGIPVVGAAMALPAVARQWLPLLAVAALLMGAGMALSNYWRWTRRRRARRPSRRAKLPPLDL
ncbi:hypothetical protein G6W47_19800 [Streptomyces sp. CAI-21]|uniref:hypothetical protein n=1 Tax=Streptomyces TaxID=1883 RepID=UPI00158726D5|nr:hypothetical protein [Streptomyces sp. NA13]MBO1285049.1 hypothetical protein [Streptomyces sampsonii]NUW09149.1 hypothetical protein [Streptomyces sp. CAI-21]NVI32568.1 hypothetical protein [Streptomyces sp. CAI-17]WAC96545.1 hypothetical protein OSU72_10470 [Streptomyces sp. NA13]